MRWASGSFACYRLGTLANRVGQMQSIQSIGCMCKHAMYSHRLLDSLSGNCSCATITNQDAKTRNQCILAQKSHRLPIASH